MVDRTFELNLNEYHPSFVWKFQVKNVVHISTGIL